MNIIELKVMRGPNIWSGYRKKLIVMKLDLGEAENFPSNKIDGFPERLESSMPSLKTHRCSEEEEGGFLKRVRNGTWMGHVIEHVALELQTLGGMDVGYGRTRSTRTKGIYHVVFSYEHEEAGLYAAKAAVRFVEAIINDVHYDLTEDIRILSRHSRRNALGPSTGSIVNEAEERNIPWTRLDDGSTILFGQGCNQKMIQATVASTTSHIAVQLACDKDATRKVLTSAFVPMPKGEVIYDIADLENTISRIGYPLVMKPIDGNHGRGITTNITNEQQAAEAFRLAQQVSEDVIVEQHINGTDYRFLVINYKLVSVAKRVPAMVIGDGTSTIQQLVEEVNKDPRRGDGHQNVLTRITIDEHTLTKLKEQNLTPQSVIPIGEVLFLKDTANLSSGGTARDVTDLVHPANVFLAERIARLMNLDICGIDIMAQDINVPITGKNGGVLEVNAAPGFRMHLEPTKGLGRNVAAPVMDMLYPGNAPSRIPLVAVTGTNGKTTVTRLIAHFAKTAGHTPGFTTTDGIYINNALVYSGDCSGPASAAVILRDPIVDFAVLECARGGILRAGLGFDKCNISVVTNVSEDHLGLNDIETIEDLAKVKAVVPQSTFDDGCAILNADDDLVYDMREDLDCRIALFSMDATNERIIRHYSRGGLAAFVEKGYFVICKGPWKTRILKVAETPITFGGKAEFMVKNVLPALLAGSLSGFSPAQLAQGLKTFIPSPQTTPGRMNLFRFANFRLLVDYAHNPAGFEEIKKYMSKINASVKTGVISATGDRRPEDIRSIGRYAAEIFDEIIIKHDRDGRGRKNHELTELLMQGIGEVKHTMPVEVISDEKSAIQYAVDNAREGSFVFIGADDIPSTLTFVSDLQEGNKTLSYESQR